MTERVTPIWSFATASGMVRVLLEVNRDTAEDLHVQLAACAVIAEDLTEFMRLAHRAADEAGAMIGELMKQPWPDTPFRDALRAAFDRPHVFGAADAVLRAAGSARPEDTEKLLEDPDWQVERDFVYGVLHSLDEMAARFLIRLAGALAVAPARLALALGVRLDEL